MILISPAKNLNTEIEQIDYSLTIPKFVKKAESLVSLLRLLIERPLNVSPENKKAAAFKLLSSNFLYLSKLSLLKESLTFINDCKSFRLNFFNKTSKSGVFVRYV